MSEDDRDESVCLITAKKKKKPNTIRLKWQNKEETKVKQKLKIERKKLTFFPERCFVVFVNITQYHTAILFSVSSNQFKFYVKLIYCNDS